MQTPLRTAWEGFYHDGQTARRHPVTVTVTPTGLHITKEDGLTLWWLYEQIRQTQGFHPGEPVRLEKGEGIAEVLVVPEAAILEAIRELAPEAARRFHSPARRTAAHLPLLTLALLGAALLAVALYFWAIPALTEAAAARVPASWEEQLGRAAVEQLAPEQQRCDDPERVQVLNQIVTALEAAAPPSPFRYTITVVDDSAINAFAAPGGQIILLRGLLEKTQSAEELAGVLAHEMQHVEQRHSLKALFRELSLRAVVAVVAGDAAGMRSALEAAGTLGNLRYQRADEEAADEKGIQMLQAARIDPAGLIRALERLNEDSARMPAGFQYLSTHPLTEARVERLRRLAAQSPAAPVPLLPAYPWTAMGNICENK